MESVKRGSTPYPFPAESLSPSPLVVAARAALKWVDNLNEEVPVDQNCPECVGTVFYVKGKGPQPEDCWIHQIRKALKSQGEQEKNSSTEPG
jgi:hypothetical protein